MIGVPLSGRIMAVLSRPDVRLSRDESHSAEHELKATRRAR